MGVCLPVLWGLILMARHLNRGTDKIIVGSNGTLQPASLPVSFAGWATFDSFTAESWCYANYTTGVAPGVHLIRSLTSAKLNLFWLDSVGTGHGPTGATTLSTGTWYHIGGTISTSSGNVTATVYLNGASDGVTTNTASWGAHAAINSMLGASVSGATMAGSLADWAFWTTTLNANQMLGLASGAHPPMVAPSSLVSYWPLWGDTTPEPDYSSNKNTGAVTGTTIVKHPRILTGVA